MTARAGGAAPAGPPVIHDDLQGKCAGFVSRFASFAVDVGVSLGVFMLALAAISFAARVLTGKDIAWNRGDVWVVIAYAVWGFIYFAYSWAAGGSGGPPLPWTVTTLGSLGTGGTPMVTKYQKFGDGYKAEAVKLYRESNQTIAETARNLGLKESTLANWVKKDKENEAVAAGEAPLTPAERARIRELEADVRRLNMENAFLKKASAYFASQNL